MYDSKNLYVAYSCSLKNVDNFRKIHIKRDEVTLTEYVFLMLDTYCKYKDTYFIAFNPYGEVVDGIRNVNGNMDTSQDFEIYSKGKIYGDRYEIEAKIPFKNFKFKNHVPFKWGFGIVRLYYLKKGKEQDLNVKIDRNSSNILQFEDYLLFNKKVETRSFYFIPEIITSYNKSEYDSSYDSSYDNSYYKGNLGGTFFLRPDSETRVGVTLNPDFSEVEADDIKFDVNHRFPIYYEEKRPFFLESNENFSNPMLRLFHSRNIIDPDLGIKFIKDWGNNTVASLFSIERNQLGDRFGFKNVTDDIYWYILRYKYNLKGRSYVGMYSLNRKFKSSNNNVFALDGVYRISNKQRVNFMGLYSRYTNSPMFNLNEIEGGGWDLEYHYTSRYFNYDFETFGLSDGFLDDAGFIYRNNYWYYKNNFRLHYQAEKSNEKIRYASLSYRHLVGYDFMGHLTDRMDYVGSYVDFKGDFSLFFGVNNLYELFLENGYRYLQKYINLECEKFKKVTFGMGIQFGDGVYYSKDFPQKGNYYSINPFVNVYLTSNLTLTFNGFYSKMDSISSEKKLYGFFASQISGKYQFSKNTNLKVLYEYTHYNYPLYSYNSDNHFLQVIETYNPRTYTAIYAGVVLGKNHNYYEMPDWDYEKNYKIFVKIDYMFDIDF